MARPTARRGTWGRVGAGVNAPDATDPALSRHVAVQHQAVEACDASRAEKLANGTAGVVDHELPALIPQAHCGPDDHVETLGVHEGASIKVQVDRSAVPYLPQGGVQLAGTCLIELPVYGDAGATIELRKAESVGRGTQLRLPSLGLLVSQYSARPRSVKGRSVQISCP
jgi:hypothetical protein